MTDAAVVQASYSDFKLIKSRSSAQIILELPIERAEAFLKVFGVPQPGAERPVALALLNVQKPAEQERPKKPFHELSRAQQAGILCADERFQKWLGARDDVIAAAEVRLACNVNSRTELDATPRAANKWDALVSRYRVAVGLETERR